MDIGHVGVEEVSGTMEVLNLKWEEKKKCTMNVYIDIYVLYYTTYM